MLPVFPVLCYPGVLLLADGSGIHTACILYAAPISYEGLLNLRCFVFRDAHLQSSYLSYCCGPKQSVRSPVTSTRCFLPENCCLQISRCFLRFFGNSGTVVWKNPSRSALCETLRPARSTVLSILRLVWTSAGHVHSGNTSVQVCHCCPLMTDEPNEVFAKGVSSCEWTIGTVMLRHVLLFIWGLSSNIWEPAEDQMILVCVLMRELPVCRSFSSSVCQVWTRHLKDVFLLYPTGFLGRTKTTTDIVFQKLAAVSIKDGVVWEKITGHHKTIWTETEGPLFCLPLLHFIIE